MANDRTAAALQAAFAASPGVGRLSPPEQAFLVQAAADWSDEELADWRARDLAELARPLWSLAESFAGRGPELRIRRDRERATPLDIIEIVQTDRPFIVASVMGEISARGIVVEAMTHPVVEIAGRRLSLIQVAAQPFADHAGVRRGLAGVLEDVTAATDDFAIMTERLEGAIAALTASGQASEEELAFLKWLDAGRFIFLGARSYDYPAKGPPTLLPQTGLGMLRDPTRLVLRNSDEPSVLSAMRRRLMEQGGAVTVAKSNLKSLVHRRVHMDYFGVKRFENGAPVGEDRFVGLFAAEAYNQSVDQTPLIRRKTADVSQRAGVSQSGHSAARLKNILETWPRDDLFQISEDDLLKGALQALHLQDRPRVDFFVRRDPFDRFASIIVYVPRERFEYGFVERAGALLADAYDGRVSAVYPEFGDSALAQIHYIIGFSQGRRADPDSDALRSRLADLARTFADRVAEAARKAGGDAEEAEELARRAEAFPPGYQALNNAADALSDMTVLDQLSGGAISVKVSRRRGDSRKRLRLKIYAIRGAPALADVVPVLEHMGLKAIREDAFTVSAAASRSYIDEYLLEDRSGEAMDLDEIGPMLEEAFVAVWLGRTESDGFNRLVIELGFGWREAALIRAFARYRQQSGFDPSQAVQEQAFADHPDVARLILDLFRTRFDPAGDASVVARQQQAHAIFGQIEQALQAVDSLDADRALRRIAHLVQATVRTNFYQTDKAGQPKPYIAFKVASRGLADLPSPKPFREIFVSSPQVDGVHLRLGPVARGGLRWSDRRDDFRTEVLALVKAQQVKNAVIVPVGSKGGFYPKRLPRGGGSDAVRAEGVKSYTTFVSALLDLTDNLDRDGEPVRPRGVIAHDPDDPYLVVAADKGTATFSDIANGIAESYGFWLGDAFASGGSAGYDHKAMGITARGAWEAVKRHFRELGKDIQAEPFTVIGVGDMSGDVFGNGMLLSRKIRLLAAFDHRHVFIDPEPDPEPSWLERQRLFGLPRSSWDDYDRSLISAGGGVFPRSAKSIPLSTEVQALLDLKADALPPFELISAILRARAELLYLGGVGTYVKASTQSHADVGDKANDGLRINATELRCKVVGEGANLGFTQAARIEFALGGGCVNTDAIDNSAGVDCSDHEVNIKILTGMIERAGALTRPDRNALLASMTDQVAAHVLRHNYEQTLALSLMEAEAADDLDAHGRLMIDLEQTGRLDRQVEGLPDAKALDTRGKAQRGLMRPELAVLLAYGKLELSDLIVAGSAPDDPYFLTALRNYFPEALGRYEAEMKRHRLRREIIATVLANDIVNLCGPTFPGRLRAAAGCETTGLVVAFQAAKLILDFDALWSATEALDGQIPAAGQITLFRELAYILRGQTFWLARRLAATPSSVRTLTRLYADPVAALMAEGLPLLSAFERKAAAERCERFAAAGAPKDLALKVAALRPLTTAIDLVDLAQRSSWPTQNVARLYHQVGGAMGFDRLRAAAGSLSAGDTFERTAVRRLVEEMLAEQTALTASILKFAASPQAGETPDAAAAAIASWSSLHHAPVRKAEETLAAVETAEGGWTFAKLTIANAALRDLATLRP